MEPEMKPGSYIKKFSRKAFKDHVGDKFQKLIQSINQRGILAICQLDNLDVNKLLYDLKIESLIPNLTNKGKVDKRCSIGHNQLVTCESLPAALNFPESPSTLNEMSSGQQGAPARLNLSKRFTSQVTNDYHEDQYDLLNEVINFDDNKQYMLNADNIKATPEEFAQAIDNVSILVLTALPDVVQPKVINRKIDLCYKILIKRLWLHSDARNDIMMESGWKTWREHALVIGSFAVYYLSLQLYRMVMYGTYYQFC